MTEEVDLGDAGKGAGGTWVDILTGKPAATATAGRLKVALPALTGTTLVRTKGE